MSSFLSVSKGVGLFWHSDHIWVSIEFIWTLYWYRNKNKLHVYIYIYWIKLYWFIPLETITALVEWTIFFEPPPRDRLTFPYTVSLSVSNISFSTIDGITRVIKADGLLQYVYKTKVFTEKCFHTVREKILRLSMHASMHYPTSQVQVTWNYLTCKESNMKTEAN